MIFIVRYLKPNLPKKRELGLELEIDTTLQIVGVAHNVLLDEMMPPEANLSEYPGVESYNTVQDKFLLIGTDSSEEPTIETFRDEFSTQMVVSSTFKMDFAQLVNDQLVKSQEGLFLEEADSIPEYIMNLFLEASHYMLLIQMILLLL